MWLEIQAPIISNFNTRKVSGSGVGNLHLTGGKLNSLATSVFLIAAASSNVKPLTRSVINDEEAIADPHPKVLNFTSLIRPDSSTRICSFMTSPQAGAPTLKSVEILHANSEAAIERRRDQGVERE